MEWPSAATELSWISPSREPRRRSSVAARRNASKTEALSHTGSFGWNLSSRELVCSDETFRILEDDRSVNRHSISFERIHPEHLSSARPSVRNNRKRTSHVLRPHVVCEYNGSHPDVHVTFDRHLSDNEKKTRMKASEFLQNDQSTATEKALRFAFDTTPAFIHTARPDGHFDYFNRGWLDFLGKSLEDVCGWRWTESVHPEDVAGIVQKWRAALASGEPFVAEARVRCGDGTYRAFLHRKVPLHDEHGNIVKWFGSSIDIEDRKRAEKHRPLEAELQATLNVIPAYTWYALPSGALTFVNERTADYLGIPKDHPLRFGIDTGAEWDSHIPLLHPDDHEETRRVWSACLRTGCAGEISFRVRNAEGGYRWFHSRIEPLWASDGTLLYWVGVNLDIEERKQAEFYLAEGQRLAHTGSWAFNSAGFDYWSSELFRIYGLDPSGKAPTVEEYIGLVHPEDRGFVGQAIQKMLADHRGFDFTKRIVRPDGEIRCVRCVGVAACQGFVGTGIDVTEQKQLMEELRRNEYYLAEGQRLAQMGSWVFDPAGFFNYWSRELFRIYGFEPADEGPSLEEYLARVHPQDREFMGSLIKRMLAEASGCDVTKRIVRPNGEVRYVRCVGAPVIEDGTLKRIVGTAIDVTEHELLTQELRRREAYLVEAQRLSHTGSFGWNLATGELVWSDENFRIIGYEPTVKPTVDLVPETSSPGRSLVCSANDGEGENWHELGTRAPTFNARWLGQTSPRDCASLNERIGRA